MFSILLNKDIIMNILYLKYESLFLEGIKDDFSSPR